MGLWSSFGMSLKDEERRRWCKGIKYVRNCDLRFNGVQSKQRDYHMLV
jgi:hypothetical protein